MTPGNRAAAAVAFGVWVGLGVVRVAFEATAFGVSFLGHPLELGCAFRAHFGIPCPGCGFTRSLVLTVHGELASAWAIHPLGPLLVAGALLFSFALLSVALVARTRFAASRSKLLARIQLATFVFCAVALAVWAVHWAGACSSSPRPSEAGRVSCVTRAEASGRNDSSCSRLHRPPLQS